MGKEKTESKSIFIISSMNQILIESEGKGNEIASKHKKE